jgi:hypothetical protein
MITSNFKSFMKSLNDFEKKQIPFAYSKAINDTVYQAKLDLEMELLSKLDRPTKFTQRAVGVRKANKRDLYAEIFIKDIQASYLKHHYFGITRKPKNKAIATPTKSLRLNKYGNMTKRKIAKMLESDNYFSGEVKGRKGIFRKYKNGTVKQMITWKDEQPYDKLMNFSEIVMKRIDKSFEDNFESALRFAIRSAR